MPWNQFNGLVRGQEPGWRCAEFCAAIPGIQGGTILFQIAVAIANLRSAAIPGKLMFGMRLVDAKLGKLLKFCIR
jgi:hypothetical protein